MRDSIVVNAYNKQELNQMKNPVALSIPGAGTFAYVELNILPPEIMSALKDKAWQLQREIERKQDVLARLTYITGELR